MQIDTRNILSQHQNLAVGNNNAIESTHRIDLGPIDDITDLETRRMSKGLHYIPGRRTDPDNSGDPDADMNGMVSTTEEAAARVTAEPPGVNIRRRVGRTGDIPLLIALSTDLVGTGTGANRSTALLIDFMHADAEAGTGESALRCIVPLLDYSPTLTNRLLRRTIFPIQFIPREITRRYFFLRYTAIRAPDNFTRGEFSAGNITATIASAVHAGYSGTGR